ncbi:MAG TPA: copper-binding protein [Candidatus Binatia bacterium]|nr:copper-binding protein [Candidatus Binatia bacterium]
MVLVGALGCGRTSTYSADGDVIAVDEQRQRVTIAHDDIPGLMPAMTMQFPVASPAVLAGANAGTRVRFELERDGPRLTVTHIVPSATATAGRPGVHDHTPHHGGVVAMIGMLHLEATASADGVVRVYPSDVWRRPLPVQGVTGSVRIDLADGRRTLALRPAADALEATGPPLPGSEVLAHVDVVWDGSPVEANYVLPLRPGATAAVLVPEGDCTPPPADATTGGRRPRCVLVFPKRIAALAASPDGAVVVVSTMNGGITAWRMPGPQLIMGFAPAPARAMPAAEPPHEEVAIPLVVSPDGTEAIAVHDRRLLRHSVASGRIVRVLGDAPGIVRSLTWPARADRLLLTAFADEAAHLIDPSDGRELTRIPLSAEGAAAAFASDGRRAAIGDEHGTIVLVDGDGTSAPVALANTRRSVMAIGFAGRRVIAGGPEGVLRVWDTDTRALVAESAPGPGILSLAVAPGGEVAATVDLDGLVRVRDVTTAATLAAIEWHADTYAIAWSGNVLLTGGSDGTLALWDVEDVVQRQ